MRAPSRPRPSRRAAAAVLILGLVGCEDRPATPPAAAGSAAPRYVARTTGTNVELWNHLQDLGQRYAETAPTDPVQARKDQAAYADAIEATADALIARADAPMELRQRAMVAELQTLVKRASLDPKGLDRLLAAIDRIEAAGKNTEIGTIATFERARVLAEAPPEMFRSDADRGKRMGEAMKKLALADPPHPQAPMLLNRMARAAETMQMPDLAREMFTLLAERFPKDPMAPAAAASAARIDLIGKPIDEFRGTGAEDRKIDLKDLRGKVVLIDFWATTCAPCLKEMPRLKELRDQLTPKGLEVLGVCIDESPEAGQALVRAHEIGWPQIFTGGPKGPLVERFGVEFIPFKMLVDREGKLVAAGYGLDDLRSQIEALVPEAKGITLPPPPPPSSTPSGR